MSSGELAGVWSEGLKGIGKPFSERYKLQRFGRGGFVSAAIRSGVPIVPCSIVGAEEIYPIIGNVKILARLFGFPYVPVTPTFPLLGPLGLLPLPSKWIIEFGEPIATNELDRGAADDPMLVFNLTDQVREVIQQTLYKLLLGPLGLVPLPSKWIIEFGEPIHTDQMGAGAADDPMLVFNLTDQVRETIQSTLYTLLMQRRSVFF